MLTTKYVRDHINEIKKSLEKRKSAYPIDELLNLDMDIRKLKTELQELQAKRNKESMEISEKKKKNEDIGEKINTLKVVKEKIEAIESELPSYQDRVNFLLWNMPNILHESVPYGKNDEENIEMKKWGEQKNKKNGKSHDEILKELDMVDIERAAKVSGARFYYLKNDLVLLEQSLLRFALDFFIKKGFTPISPPFMLRKEYYRGVTALGDFEDALYKISDPKEISGNNEYEKLEDELFLISTSEHPMAAMHSNEVFPASKLPLKYVGISPCFRREAGSHGKDTKGIFRVHQFNKVEQFIFSKQEDSWSYFNELLSNSEEIVKDLGIPYRIVNICTGDIGIVAAKKIDIEAYMPLQKKYREITSCSNCTDWQSLRLDIKYDENNERKYVHTLNSTGIAAQRLIVAIVENYVNDDGTITVPKLLVPYLGKEILGK
ncbi:serine--tRNA ligase [Candidatus Marsarchaeota archaeon]|nr:serine--tRNA ligase [Candidatus Marsarchaeota archaeon]